jgi:hypothetical protein
MGVARFVGVYFIAFYLCTQLFMVPGGRWLDAAATRGLNTFVPWVSAHLFGLSSRVTVTGSGVGDVTSSYVVVGCLAIFAFVVAALWPIRQRDPRAFARELAWGHAALRFAAAMSMLSYGTLKVIPGSQFGTLEAGTLIMPLGSFHPMNLLWAFMAYSPIYQFFGGLAELAAGCLLWFRRTATLGAVIAFAVMANVAVLNVAYDVVVKVFAIHLLVLTACILAPDVRRVWRFVLSEPAVPEAVERASLTRASRWCLRGVQVAALTALVAFFVHVAQGYAAAKSRPNAFNGLWEVDRYTSNGREVPALRSEANRWKRMAIDEYQVVIQFETDSTVAYRFTTDTVARTIAIRGRDQRYGTFAVRRPDSVRMILRGIVEHDTLDVWMSRRDLSTMRLTRHRRTWNLDNVGRR